MQQLYGNRLFNILNLNPTELQQQADKINIPYWEHVITVIGKQETFQKLQRQEIRKVIQPAYPKEACIWVQEFFLGELLKPEEEADGSNENTSQGEGNDANTINAQKYLVNKGQREVKHNNLDNHEKSNVNEGGTKDTQVGPATHQKKNPCERRPSQGHQRWRMQSQSGYTTTFQSQLR